MVEEFSTYTRGAFFGAGGAFAVGVASFAGLSIDSQVESIFAGGTFVGTVGSIDLSESKAIGNVFSFAKFLGLSGPSRWFPNGIIFAGVTGVGSRASSASSVAWLAGITSSFQIESRFTLTIITLSSSSCGTIITVNIAF